MEIQLKDGKVSNFKKILSSNAMKEMRKTTKPS